MEMEEEMEEEMEMDAGSQQQNLLHHSKTTVNTERPETHTHAALKPITLLYR